MYQSQALPGFSWQLLHSQLDEQTRWTQPLPERSPVQLEVAPGEQGPWPEQDPQLLQAPQLQPESQVRVRVWRPQSPHA